MTKIFARKYEESKLQQLCVAWFRAQYPQFAMLLTHPINEGSAGTRVTGAIHKAEGTVAGVSDLLFFLPSKIIQEVDENGKLVPCVKFYHGLCIEFKTETGSQSQEQKDWQKYVEAAGYKYVVIRHFNDFMDLMITWVNQAYEPRREKIAAVHYEIEQANAKREKEHFLKVIGKK